MVGKLQSSALSQNIFLSPWKKEQKLAEVQIIPQKAKDGKQQSYQYSSALAL